MKTTIALLPLVLCFFLSLFLAFAQDDPVYLRLAVADAAGRPSEPHVLEFIKQAQTLSNGSITIEPFWDAGSDTEAGFEAGVVEHVTAGDFELGLAGSRAWNGAGVTSLDALQAPFLIDNDALAEAVATSDIAARMLEGMSSAGMVGLALWPEDLRHPFAIPPQAPLLSPDDFAGLNIRTVPSGISYALIEALGGTPMFEGGYEGAESGLLQGASLTGTPTATGNVVFFPKFQVLFANGEAFEGLSDEQQTVLRDAAVATQQKAIAEHPRDADAAAAWCADGGTIVMASEEQLAAFEEAARPVLEQIEQDPLNAELIAAVRDLKASTEPSPGAEACAPTATQASPEPSTDAQVWSEGLPPNGTWQVELTADDLVKMGLLRAKAEEGAGLVTWTFEDGQAMLSSVNGPAPFTCTPTYAVVEDFVRFTYTGNIEGCGNGYDDIQWRLEDDGLHLHLVDITGAPFAENKAYLEAKPWQKVE